MPVFWFVETRQTGWCPVLISSGLSASSSSNETNECGLDNISFFAIEWIITESSISSSARVGNNELMVFFSFFGFQVILCGHDSLSVSCVVVRSVPSFWMFFECRCSFHDVHKWRTWLKPTIATLFAVERHWHMQLQKAFQNKTN
jgi:hypothetical protein